MRTNGWLGGEAGHSDERPVTSLLPPLLKEHWHSKKPLAVVFFLISRHRRSWKDNHLTYTAVLYNTTLRKATPNYTHRVM